MVAAEPKIWLSQSDFAKRRGVNRATVNKWKGKGLLVQNEEGLIDVHETEWKLDERPPTYRGGVAHRPVRATEAGNKTLAPGNNGKKERPQEARQEIPSKPDADDQGDALDNLPMAEAVRRKENFLGLLRKHEFEVGQREWVRIEDVGQLVERDYATIRERLLVSPGKLAARLVGLSRSEIELILRQEATETLNELHDPDGFAEHVASGDQTPASQAGSEAAADPQRGGVG